jgi:hypothetical protein
VHEENRIVGDGSYRRCGCIAATSSNGRKSEDEKGFLIHGLTAVLGLVVLKGKLDTAMQLWFGSPIALRLTHSEGN